MRFLLERCHEVGDTVLWGDVVGVIAVYAYVAVLMLITEKVLSKKYTLFNRKLLHIMVGNIAFLLPIFQTREIMAFVAAGPFIIITFLISPLSPLKTIRDRLSKTGHGLGLVYYAIAWTVLAYVFFDYKEIIAIGILAMSYGDGFASLLGIQFGKRKYCVFKDEKSIVGSITMFLFTLLFIEIALLYYQIPMQQLTLPFLLVIAFIGTSAEGLTPRGLDNLSVPFLTAGFYWWLHYSLGVL